MGDRDPMVDGNAAAGILSQVFIHEMTSARAACRGCGTVEPLGAEHVYMQAPGVVFRCCHCDDVLLVITEQDGAKILSFNQLSWIEISDGP